MSQSFHCSCFEDCAQITEPAIKDLIYVLLSGRVAIIDNQQVFQRIQKHKKLLGRKRQKIIDAKEREVEQGHAARADLEKIMKQMELKDEEEILDEAAGAENVEQEDVKDKNAAVTNPGISDIPLNDLSKSDFKMLKILGSTFGNDKIITSKNFRPSYAIAVGKETKILSMPLRVVDEAIKKLANTGENKEKSDFFKHYDWFYNFTQSLKTKFNNLVTKKVFYPGSYLFKEGQTISKCYIIVDGTCHLIQTKPGKKFAMFEYKDNPGQFQKDKEALVNRNRSTDNPSMTKATQQSSSLTNLVNNGYVSKTLKTIQIGIKSKYEWIGEDLLGAADPNNYIFDYSALVKSKLVTYEIEFTNMCKIVPLKERERMKEIVEMRKHRKAERAVNHYMNLK